MRRQLLCGTLLLCLFMQHAPTTTAVGHGNTFLPALECYDQYGRPQVS